jgi:hypothetical protein
MAVTDEGMAIAAKLLQWVKALSPMELTEGGMVKLAKLLQ